MLNDRQVVFAHSRTCMEDSCIVLQHICPIPGDLLLNRVNKMGKVIVISIDCLISPERRGNILISHSMNAWIISQLTWHESCMSHAKHLAYVTHVPLVSTWDIPAKYLDVSSTWLLGIFPLLSYQIFYYVGLSTTGDGCVRSYRIIYLLIVRTISEWSDVSYTSGVCTGTTVLYWYGLSV